MNPEFQRNLWLEASPRRVAWAAVVVALVYGAAIMLQNGTLVGRSQSLNGAAGLIFVVSAMVWGSRAAANTVLNEIAERTWDFQRLSALSPWAMTWGKLLGGASLAWLCAATGAVVLLVDGLSGGEPARLWSLAFMIALAVLLQAVSMGSALIGVRKARAEGRAARPGGVLGGLILGGFLLLAAASSAGFQRGAGLKGFSNLFGGGDSLVDWWGQVIPSESFRAVFLALFAAWAVVGAWRLMRLELQMRNAPLVWPTFLVFLALFAGGFAWRSGGPGGALLAGALVVALCAYAAAFAEPADRVRLRRFANLLRQGEVTEASALTPAALAPVILTTLMVVASLSASPRLITGETPHVGQAAGLLAFMIRDLGVIALFRFGPRPQRGDFGAVVALAVLYAVGSIVGHGIGGQSGAALFAPLADAPLASFLSGAVQAAIAWYVAARRIAAPEASAVSPPAAASAPGS